MARKKVKPIHHTPFTECIVSLRKAKGLTMTALSDSIGVTPSYVSLLEAGERQPSREIVLKIGQLFFSEEDTAALDDLLILAGLSPTRPNQSNQPQGLLAYYEDGLKENPHNFSLYLAMIRTLIHNAWPQLAEEKIYSGMKTFHQTQQLQTLMSHLQLSLQNFEAAHASQESALLLYLKTLKEHEEQSDLSDLYATQGLINFLWGMSYLKPYIQAIYSESNEKAQAFIPKMHPKWVQACDAYQSALEKNPAKLELQDEYIRVLLKLADLSCTEQAALLWEKAIKGLIHLICSEGFNHLEAGRIREISVSLAYAYTKSGNFAEARKLIGILQAAYPNYWQVYYIKACHFALQYGPTDPNEALLDLALLALKKSLAFKYASVQIQEQIQTNLDLKNLHLHRSQEFSELLR